MNPLIADALLTTTIQFCSRLRTKDNVPTISESYVAALDTAIAPETSIKESHRQAEIAIDLLASNRFMQIPSRIGSMIDAIKPQHTDAGIRRDFIDCIASIAKSGRGLFGFDDAESLLDIAKNDRDLYVRAMALDIAVAMLAANQYQRTESNIRSLFEIAADEKNVAKMLKTNSIVPAPDEIIIRNKALMGIRKLSAHDDLPNVHENFGILVKMAKTDVGTHNIKVEGLYGKGLDSKAAYEGGDYLQQLAHSTAMYMRTTHRILQNEEDLAALNECGTSWNAAKIEHEKLRSAQLAKKPLSEANLQAMRMIQSEP